MAGMAAVKLTKEQARSAAKAVEIKSSNKAPSTSKSSKG